MQDGEKRKFAVSEGRQSQVEERQRQVEERQRQVEDRERQVEERERQVEDRERLMEDECASLPSHPSYLRKMGVAAKYLLYRYICSY